MISSHPSFISSPSLLSLPLPRPVTLELRPRGRKESRRALGRLCRRSQSEMPTLSSLELSNPLTSSSGSIHGLGPKSGEEWGLAPRPVWCDRRPPLLRAPPVSRRPPALPRPRSARASSAGPPLGKGGVRCREKSPRWPFGENRREGVGVKPVPSLPALRRSDTAPLFVGGREARGRASSRRTRCPSRGSER